MKIWLATIVVLLLAAHCYASEETVEGLRKLGDEQLASRNYNKAADFYSKAIGIKTISKEDKIRLYYKRAEAYYLRKDYVSATMDCSYILQNLDDSYTQAMMLRGQIALVTGDFFKAINNFENYIKHKSQNPGKATELLESSRKSLHLLDNIETLKNEGKFEECETAAETLLTSVARESTSIKILQTECAIEAGHVSAARTYLNRILSQEEDNIDALYLYGKSLYYLGAVDPAQSYLKRCLQSDPDNRKCRVLTKEIKKLETVYNDAEALFEKGNSKKAADAFEQFIQSAGVKHYRYPDALNRICESQIKEKNAEKAVSSCKLAADAFNSLDTLVNLAEAHLLNDDLESARTSAAQAQEKDQNSDKVRQINQKIKRFEAMAKRKDYYKILGIAKNASQQDIKKAYRVEANKWHPDKHSSSTDEEKKKAEERFRDIAEAKEVLSDDEKRARYDSGEDLNEPNMGGGSPFGDFSFFQQQQGFNFHQGGGQHGFKFHFG